MAAFFKRFDVRVTAVYGIVAALWIIISDRLIAAVSPQNILSDINTLKGLGFVAVTALALFIIISREARQRTQYEQTLQGDLRALEQAEATEREQSRFAEALRDSLVVLTASLDVDQVMQQILESAAAVVPSEAGSIVLFENHQGRIAYTRGFPPEFQKQISEYRFTEDHPQSSNALGSMKPYLISDTKTHPNWVSTPFTDWIRSSIGIPIELHGKAIGILNSDSAEPNHFKQPDLEKLSAFARYAALALQNAYHVTRLEQKVDERTAELQSAKFRVEAILNNSIDGILLAYGNLHIQQTNIAFNRLLACDFDDYFNRSLLDLIDADEVPRVSNILEKVTSERTGAQFETCVRRKDGTLFDAELSIGVIRDSDNQRDNLVAAIRDITERKRAEQALTAKLDEEREFQQHLKRLHEITIELTQIDQLDEFYKRAVELGLERLNFERLALFLYDEDDATAIGTYGTDSQGTLAAEHELRLQPPPTGVMMRAFAGDERFAFEDQTDLYNGQHHVIGKGWNATAVLRSGTQGLGWIVADNLISQKPAAKSQLDILALYGLTLGTLLAQKRVQVALSAKLDEEREFQQHLKTLHEITIELTQIDQLDEFYKRAVEFGLERLGFERLGLFLYDEQQASVSGTYGTDEQGQIIDEHHVNVALAPTHLMTRALERVEHVSYDGPIPLYTHGNQLVGTGWNAVTVLRSGAKILGWLSTDNLINQRTMTKPMFDILELYGLTLGTLLARKQTDDALRESESRLRESQQMLQNILETIPVGVFWKDRNSAYMGCSRTVVEDTGLTSSESIIGKRDEELPWRDYAEAYKAGDKEILEESTSFLDYEQHIPSPNGMNRWFYTIKVPLRNITGEIIGILGVYTDITERKRSEEALRQAFEREKELGELKSRFVSMASHELRTPLTSILSAAEILTRYREKMDSQQIQEKLDLITRQVAHLADIIEDVLNLGRMQSGHSEFNPTTVDLDLLCQDIVAEFKSQSTITHEVHYDGGQQPVILHLDRKLMRQVITNLISNAIKYSPTSKQVWIALERHNESAVLCVRDTGIGIPAIDIKHLFEPFHRARNVGAISGTGLGLAISKEAVELHGGTISVESEVGAGTTICVHLPAT